MISREESRKREIEPLHPILERVIAGIREQFDSQKHASFDIQEQWEELMGEEIARHTRPKKITKGVLTIAVDSPAWHQELSQFAKPFLMKTLKAKWPWIQEIKFKTVGF